VTPVDPQAKTPSALRPMAKTPGLRESRELIVNLTLREIRSKYKQTALGHAWSLVNPLAIMLMYTLVFAVILKQQPPKGENSGLHLYALYLMTGLLPWAFFNNATVSSMGAIVGNANLLKKVFFRRDVLVSSNVFSWLVTFSIEMGVLLVALLAFGSMPLPWIPLVLLTMALLTLFALGLGLALSIVNVYFRDTEHFVNIFFLLWFYLTPVLYPLTRVQEAARHKHVILGWDVPLLDLYELNPMERFVSIFRSMLYDNAWPQWDDIVYCVVVTALSLAIGTWIFRRFEGRVTEEL
jgi:ABC-2 type transport system permease protein